MDSNSNRKGWQYSKQFEVSQKKIEPDCRSFDEMIDAVLDSISRAPSIYPFVIKSDNLQVCKTKVPNNKDEVKHLSIFFIDKTETILLVDIIEQATNNE